MNRMPLWRPATLLRRGLRVRQCAARQSAPVRTLPPLARFLSDKIRPNVRVLTSIAQWVHTPGKLEKHFDFRDKEDAQRFQLRCGDVYRKVDRAAAMTINGAQVHLVVEGTGSDGDIGQEDVAIANSVDDIAADLQLLPKKFR